MKTKPIVTLNSSGMTFANKAWAMPNIYSLSVLSNASGTATSDAMIGTENYQTNLYVTPAAGTKLSGWNVTGGTVANNVFTFGNSDATIEPVFEEATTALLYSDLDEVIYSAINKQFTVTDVSNYPYLAVEFDWKLDTGALSNVWAYNRSCCGIPTRDHYGYGRINQAICNINQSTSSINSDNAKTSKQDSVVCCLGLNTSLTTYSNIKYIWCNNSTGFSAICDNIWRYKDARTNNITALKNFTCTNELTYGQSKRTFYLKNLKVGGFNLLEQALDNW